MKRFERLLVSMIMVGLLALPGFASQDSSPAPNSQQSENMPVDKAIVYIYRPSGSTGGKAMPFGVRVSDKVVTTQVQGGYYAYVTEPGNIEFTVFEIGLMAPKSTSSITVDAKAGLVYYLKGSHGKGAGGRAHLESVSPEVGANEIANCKLKTTTLGSTSSTISTSKPSLTPAPPLGASFQGEKIPADKAIVYIYRPSPPGGLAGCVAADVGIPFSVKASGKAVTTLVQGGYYAYVTEPGNIEFTAIEDKYSGPLAAKSPFSITLDAKAGLAYYLKGSHTHGLVVKLSLILVSQEAGSKEIVSCKLIPTTLGSTSAPITATQQAVATANVYGEKIFVGKIEYTSLLSLHIPPGRTLRLSSDNGDKLTVFVSNDIAIRDMKGYPTRIGEKAEVKYSSATNGDNEAILFRYVPLDYVQQSTVSMMPAKTTPSTQAPAQGSSFQLGETIPSDKAVVYIYRPSGSTGGKAMPFGVRVSDKVVTTQVQGGYYAYVTEPGNIEFTVFEIGLMAPKSTSSITVDAKAGLVYYLKGSHGKGAGGRAHLESVSPEVGANEIANCKVTTTQ